MMVAASVSFLGLACKRERPVVTLATTTSVQDTGLFDRLEPIVEKRIGAEARIADRVLVMCEGQIQARA